MCSFLQGGSQHDAAHARAYWIDGGAGERSYVNMQKWRKNYFFLQNISFLMEVRNSGTYDGILGFLDSPNKVFTLNPIALKLT